MVDPGGQLPVQLDEIGGQFQDVGQTCKAGTSVVYSQAHSHQAQLVEREREPLVVVDLGFLGQLHDDTFRFGACNELAHLVGDHRLGACVHAQSDIPGKAGQGVQSSLRGDDLQFDADAHDVCLGEPYVRSSLRSSREPSKRFDCEALPGCDVEHGLEDVTEPASFEDAVDSASRL